MITAKVFLPFILIFLLGLGFLIYLTWLIEPYSRVKNILISNTTDHQSTISWTTAIPTKGVIIISSNSKFPILPIFAKNLLKDDGEKNSKKIGYYTTHHITIGALESAKEYQIRIYQGQKKVYEGQFTTAPTLSTLTTPNPVYGRVLKNDKKTPVVGAIVYLNLEKESSPSALLSTLTNSKGGWSIDLANLRSKDLKTYFAVEKSPVDSSSGKTKEQAVIVPSKGGSFKAEVTYGADKPWPDIILK